MHAFQRLWGWLGHLSLAHRLVGSVVALLAGGGALTQGLPLSAIVVWGAIGLPAGIVGWELLSDSKIGQQFQLGGRASFHLDLAGPVTVARASMVGPNGPFDIVFVIRVRVTNEGEPGAAFDWIAWGEFANGQRIPLQRLDSIDHNFWGHAGGKIERSDLIWERTAVSLAMGETRVGYFLARMPLKEAEQLGEEWELCLACRDYRKRPSGMGFAVAWDPHSRQTAIEEATLPRVELDPKRRLPSPSDWVTGNGDDVA